MKPVYVLTPPRELPARWLKPGDHIATYIENGMRRLVRSAEYTARYPQRVTWLAVVDRPALLAKKPARKAGAPDVVLDVALPTVVGIMATGPLVGEIDLWDTDAEQVVMRTAIEVSPDAIVREADTQALAELDIWSMHGEGFCPDGAGCPDARAELVGAANTRE